MKKILLLLFFALLQNSGKSIALQPVVIAEASPFATLGNQSDSIIINGITYIAASGDGVQIQIYSFNGTTLTPITNATPFTSVANSVNWITFNGITYLAAVGNGPTQIQIYSFNGTTLTPITTATPFTNNGNTARWVNINGTLYLATLGFSSGPGIPQVQIYSFNGTSLTPIANDSPFSSSGFSADWITFNGITYLATTGDGVNQIQIYSFNGITLTPISSESPFATIATSVRWHIINNTLYLAITGDGSKDLIIYKLVGTTLMSVTDASLFSNGGLALNWLSIAGIELLAVGGTGGIQIEVLEFNGIILNKIASLAPFDTQSRSVVWLFANGSPSPFLATVGDDISPAPQLVIVGPPNIVSTITVPTGPYVTQENNALGIPLAAFGVTSAQLNFIVIVPPTHGIVSAPVLYFHNNTESLSQLTYIPNPGYVGPDSFTVGLAGGGALPIVINVEVLPIVIESIKTKIIAKYC